MTGLQEVDQTQNGGKLRGKGEEDFGDGNRGWGGGPGGIFRGFVGSCGDAAPPAAAELDWAAFAWAVARIAKQCEEDG